MAEEEDPGSCFRNVASGVPGFVPGGPLVRKGDGGVAFSEDFGDAIHGRRELFRLLLRQVLTKTWMKSPSRLDLFAFDAGHDTDEFNVGTGCAPWCLAGFAQWKDWPMRRRRLAEPALRKCRSSAGNDGTDTERGGGRHAWIAGGSDQAGNSIAEIAVHVVLGRAVFGDQESIAFVGLAAFRHSRPDGKRDLRLVAPDSKGRFQRFLQLIDDRVCQFIHELRLFLERNVQHRHPIGQIEHDTQKFEVDGPLVLTFEFQRLFRDGTFDHGDGLACDGEHEFRDDLHLLSERNVSGCHTGPLRARHYIQLDFKVQVLILSAAITEASRHALSLQGIQWYVIQRDLLLSYASSKPDAIMDRDIKPYILKRPVDQDIVPKLSIDYAGALNAQQLAAVTAGEGPVAGDCRRRQRQDADLGLPRGLFDRFGDRSVPDSASDLYAKIVAGNARIGPVN